VTPSTLVGDLALTTPLAALRRDGIVKVPGMPVEQVDALWVAMQDQPRFAGHVKREGRPCEGMPISCWDMHDLMMAPHFWEFALAFTPMAALYLQTAPLLYSLNLFESLPSDMDLHPGIEVFHRDYDDTRFVALFLYLTDVNPGDGSHLYQIGTQDGAPWTRTIEVCGPRGTAFLADTRGFHRGFRPTSGPRRMAWARWGVSDPPASYVRDCLRPISRERLGDRYPEDFALRQLVRLVAA
jgi:hypothetical protein